MVFEEMTSGLTKEQKAVFDTSSKFFRQVWRPAEIKLDRLPAPEDVIAQDSVLWDVFRQSYELGYHKILFPEAYGGMGLEPKTNALLLEEMGYTASGIAMGLGVCSTPYFFAMLSEDPEMQGLVKNYCEDTEGRMTGCWAITEPDHGSDILFVGGAHSRNPKCAHQVRAVLDGDHYVINGQKAAWVTNGSFAAYAAVFLGLDSSRGSEGGGIAVIPLDLPGVTRGRPLDKMGLRAANQGEIFFDEVRIPKSYMVIHDPEVYTLTLNQFLAMANASMGVTFAGTARAAFDEALRYAKERVQGARPIIEHQAVKMKLFDMFTSVEAARSLAHRVYVHNTTAEEAALEYSIAAKIFSTETAFRAASQAIQIFGSYGLSKEYLIEKLFRDTRSSMIADGVNETLALKGAELLSN